MKNRIIQLTLALSLILMGGSTIAATPNKLGPFPHIYAFEHKMGPYKPVTYTLAQQLVDELPQTYREIEYGLIQARLPDSGAEYNVIASHRLAEVGAVVDAEDLPVMMGNDSNIRADRGESKNYTQSIYVLRMKNKAGEFLAASLKLYFYTTIDDNQAEVRAHAVAIRDQLAGRVGSMADLFQSAPSRSEEPRLREVVVSPPSSYPIPYSQTEKFTSYQPQGYTLAQRLVDQLPLRYHEVEYALMHARLPNGTEQAVIASHRPEQVGELDIAVDLTVSRDEAMVVVPRKRQNYPSSFVLLPARDAQGNYLQAVWSIYFYTYPSDDRGQVLSRAIAIRDEMARQIPSLGALYQPADRNTPQFALP